MNEDSLEQTVHGFWNATSTCLVCTTIIETGLDISNANTLIVDRAESLGLSQLHQLARPRRAQSRTRLRLLPLSAEKPLTETAYDRLATIAQNSTSARAWPSR
jgi:transcription-repair coupling factor (superfamily II helicase)